MNWVCWGIIVTDAISSPVNRELPWPVTESAIVRFGKQHGARYFLFKEVAEKDCKSHRDNLL